MEGHNLRRWADGDAVLSLPRTGGPVMLEIRASNSGLIYPLETEERRFAA